MINSNLMADITIFGTNKQMFLYRSGFLWCRPSKFLTNTYFASHLSHPQGYYFFHVIIIFCIILLKFNFV